MKNVHEAKITAFLRNVEANAPHMSHEEAIDLARKLGQETMDTAQLAEAERKARALLAAAEAAKEAVD